MRKFLKWIGIIVSVVVGLLIIAAGSMIVLAGNRVSKTYNIQPQTLNIPTDTAALDRGEYIYSVSCAGCHGDDSSGTPFFEDPALGYIPAPNLTAGQGGIARFYSDTDFVRAVRHGVRPDGTPLMIMPSGSFSYLSDDDLAATIAYVKNAQPIDHELGQKSLKPFGKILMTAGALGNVIQAETIDHNASRPASVAQAVTAVYGEYLVNTGDCRNCHGAEMAGQQPGEPGAPFAPNLTPGGDLGSWTAEGFISTMRTGLTPNGRLLDSAYMPWTSYGRMNDEDLTAVFLYLSTLPELETAD